MRFSEFFCIYNAMVCFVRRRQSRELLGMCFPVKITAVNNRSAHTGSMSIHIFRSGMRDNICSPLKRTAVDRCSKCIVYDKRYPMRMCCVCKFFQIQNNKRRIGDRLSEYSFCILAERGIYFFFAAVRIHKSSFDSHFTDRVSIQIIGSSVKSNDPRIRYDPPASTIFMIA